ncbi:MAG: hypothetical protein ACRDRS_15215, partial [Pseudonocardiaceae bacterium]
SHRRLKLSTILTRKFHGQIIPLYATNVKLNTSIYTSGLPQHTYRTLIPYLGQSLRSKLDDPRGRGYQTVHPSVFGRQIPRLITVYVPTVTHAVVVGTQTVIFLPGQRDVSRRYGEIVNVIAGHGPTKEQPCTLPVVRLCPIERGDTLTDRRGRCERRSHLCPGYFQFVSSRFAPSK